MTTTTGDVRRTPVRIAMGRMAAAIRGGVAVVAGVAAVLSAAPPIEIPFLAVNLVVFLVWSALYVRTAWTRGLTGWLLTGDVQLTSWLCTQLTSLVTPGARAGGNGWVNQVASMVSVCTQLNGRPALSLPGTVLIATSFAVGTQGTSPDAVPQAVIITIQGVAAAVCMLVATRTGRDASAALDRLQATQRAAEIRRARHDDELTQLRLLHNGALTTLAMAAQGVSGSSPLLRRRAAADLAELAHLTDPDDAPRHGGDLPLHEHLDQVAARYATVLTITRDLAPAHAPPPVVQAVTEATAEALENVARHAGTAAVTLTLRAGHGRVSVEIADAGTGFDTATPFGFGLRESVIGRLRDVGGHAEVESAPGHGTRVTLDWPAG